MVFITKMKTCKIKVKTNFIGRSYRNLDNAVFVERLKVMNWETFDNENNFNEAWKIMFNYIRKFLMNCVHSSTSGLHRIKRGLGYLRVA